MKAVPAWLVIVLLGASVGACGSSGRDTSSTPNVSSSTAVARTADGFVKDDGDKDLDDGGEAGNENDDQPFLASYGDGAGQADTQAITSVVKSYYKAATVGNGAQACPLLAAGLATSLAQGQSQAKDASNTCAAALSLLFKQQRQLIAADDVATMTVLGVRVKGNSGLAVLGFKNMPEGQIILQHEGGAWKIDALLGSNIT